MSSQDTRIVLRAVATMLAVWDAMERAELGTPQHRRLQAALATVKEQIRFALDAISDEIIDPIANDD